MARDPKFWVAVLAAVVGLVVGVALWRAGSEMESGLDLVCIVGGGAAFVVAIVGFNRCADAVLGEDR